MIQRVFSFYDSASKGSLLGEGIKNSVPIEEKNLEVQLLASIWREREYCNKIDFSIVRKVTTQG